MMRTTDVAIIGGGIVGCSVAFHLTRIGIRRVTLFERQGLASGATGVCPGGVRQQFGSEAECRFARRSTAFFQRINEILEPEFPFRFEQSGYLFVFDSSRELDAARRRVAMQNALGVPSRVVDTREIADMLPDLTLAGIQGGTFCSEDGFLEDCHGVTGELARRAKETGAELVFQEVRVLRHGRASAAVVTDRDTFDAGSVVIAAGVDSVALAGQLGITLPIVAEPRRLIYTSAYPRQVLPPLLVAPERGFAGKQLSNGVFYLGWLGETAQDDGVTFAERALSAGSTLLPLLAEIPVRRIVTGIYDNTPDRRPIAGKVPGMDRVSVAAGFSGHGFMLAPAIGETVAREIAGLPVDLPIDQFSLARFSGTTPTEVMSI